MISCVDEVTESYYYNKFFIAQLVTHGWFDERSFWIVSLINLELTHILYTFVYVYVLNSSMQITDINKINMKSRIIWSPSWVLKNEIRSLCSVHLQEDAKHSTSLLLQDQPAFVCWSMYSILFLQTLFNTVVITMSVTLTE